jgi:hypothetical protein
MDYSNNSVFGGRLWQRGGVVFISQLAFSAGPVLKVNFCHRGLRSSTVAFLAMQP